MHRESYESFNSLTKSVMNILSPNRNEDHYDDRDHNRRPIEKDVEKRDLDIELLTLMSEGLITENEVEEICDQAQKEWKMESQSQYYQTH